LPEWEGSTNLRRILIVDEEAAIRLLLTKTFASAGYTVRTAMNAPQAMALLGAESFDVLLSDVNMPSVPPMDGHDLARWVARNHPAVGCVLMSGLGFECQDCPFASGCNILAKPFKRKRPSP
jgi:DNA-binding NtrC family response regulator